MRRRVHAVDHGRPLDHRDALLPLRYDLREFGLVRLPDVLAELLPAATHEKAGYQKR